MRVIDKTRTAGFVQPQKPIVLSHPSVIPEEQAQPLGVVGRPDSSEPALEPVSIDD